MPLRPTSIPELYTQKPPRFPSTARAVALCLRGGLLRRAVLERSRACLPLDAQRPRWGAFGALPVCRAQRTPITWERIKLQEQEFFASRDPEIAEAPNAAAR